MVACFTMKNKTGYSRDHELRKEGQDDEKEKCIAPFAKARSFFKAVLVNLLRQMSYKDQI